MPSTLEELWRAADAAPLLIYQIVITNLVLFTLVNAIADWFALRRPRRVDANADRPWPSVSVLIPARNEQHTLEPCVRSLLAQDYPGPLEILILDDHSEDATAAVAASLARFDGRVRWFRGGPLLPGWKGKPNALRQLAEKAGSELLLLTDADCLFAPNALQDAVAHRERLKADCISLVPRYICDTFWERAILPLQYHIVFATLPVHLVTASRNPAFAAASGAFVLIDAATYRDTGGHDAVRGELAEDIKFAQHLKRRGRRFAYGDGSALYSVRMYRSLAEIWEGFSKNLFPSMGRSLALLVLWCLFMLGTQILPFCFILTASFNGRFTLVHFTLPLIHCAVAIGTRVALALRMRQSIAHSLTHPLGWSVVLAIAVNSAYRTLSGRGLTWKGRVYDS